VKERGRVGGPTSPASSAERADLTRANEREREREEEAAAAMGCWGEVVWIKRREVWAPPNNPAAR
jgi:hypothetical protein